MSTALASLTVSAPNAAADLERLGEEIVELSGSSTPRPRGCSI